MPPARRSGRRSGKKSESEKSEETQIIETEKEVVSEIPNEEEKEQKAETADQKQAVEESANHDEAVKETEKAAAESKKVEEAVVAGAVIAESNKVEEAVVAEAVVVKSKKVEEAVAESNIQETAVAESTKVEKAVVAESTKVEKAAVPETANHEEAVVAESSKDEAAASEKAVDDSANEEYDVVLELPKHEVIELDYELEHDEPEPMEVDEVQEIKKRPLEKTGEEPPSKKNKSDDDDDVEIIEQTDKETDKDKSDRKSRENSEEKTPKRSAELVKFWKAVENDPSDFTGWTYLLQYVDSHGELEDGREAFDAFLFRYPYCYGYWKKYADFEKRKGTNECCMAVFERGFKAIPLSTDLWIHFMNYVKAEHVSDECFIRQEYERAVAACGREWRSDKLWDHYVKWELSLQDEAPTKDYREVLKIYDQILLNSTQGLSHQFDMFREFVKEHNPKDMLEITDFLALRKEILLAMVADEKTDEEKNKVVEDVEGEDTAAPPGEDDCKAKTDEENQAMREKIIHERRKVFKDTEAKVKSRYKFEENIKRPYFHIKPLERGQLKNWNEYLEFEQKQDDPSLVEILFERCLIACALYEEFWLKYTDWMMERANSETEENAKSLLIEKTRDIFHRACTHHLTKKVDIHLAWSAFEELQGDFERSLTILQKIEKEHPNLMSLMCRHINAERRRGDIDAVHSLYKDYIKNAKPDNRSDWCVKYARFLRLKCNDEKAALEILEDALLVDEKNPKLYLQLLDIYMHQKPLNESKIVEIFDATLTKEKGKMLRDKHRLLFSQRKAEFLEDFGSNIGDLLQAQASHAKLNVELKPSVTSHKEETNSTTQGSNAIKTVDSSYRAELRRSNGAAAPTTTATTTYQATNSSSYTAQHSSQYQQYGSRYGYQGSYSQYPPNYYSGGYNY